MNNILANILQFTDTAASVESGSSVLEEYSESKGLALVCFSKERPFQLHQLLLSVRNCFIEHPKEIIVLYCPGKYVDDYEFVFHKHKNVTPLLESRFTSDFIALVKRLQSEMEHIMFCVDDLIFTRKFSAKLYATTLNQDRSLFSMHVKLHPGVVYAHSGGKVCIPPKMFGAWVKKHLSIKDIEVADCISDSTLYLTFYLAQGTSEWRYPFDLCASIYRITDVLALITIAMSNETSYGSDGLSNPNKLEFTGNKVFWSSTELRGKYNKCACSVIPLACVVTVNKVQSTYDVPIYHNSIGSVELMNQLVHCTHPDNSEDVMYDFDKYKASNNLSVHIGDIWFTLAGKNGIPKPLAECQVCVVLPVYNGAAHLADCLQSLIDTPQGCSFDIVLVDDGSTDGSVNIAEAWRERCEEGDCTVNRVSLTVLRLPHQGLSAALDHGILHTTCPFIARMDADDVCEPLRLGRQLQYLCDNSSIHVVGGQALLFSGSHPNRMSCSGKSSGSSSVTAAPYLAHNMPTHPLLIQWEMFFRCAILHPTVMMRRDTVLKCGGYTGKLEGSDSVMSPDEVSYSSYIEDYWLWSRVGQRYPLSLAALPDVVISLRRHSTSKSKLEAQQSKTATLHLQCHQLSHFMAIDNNSNVARVIDPVSHLGDEDSAREAIRLLQSLRQRCIEMYDTVKIVPSSVSPLKLRYSKTQEEVSVPVVSVAVEDDSRIAVKDVLEHYFNNRLQKIVAAAAKKFPSSEFHALKFQDDAHKDAISKLKELMFSIPINN